MWVQSIFPIEFLVRGKLGLLSKITNVRFFSSVKSVPRFTLAGHSQSRVTTTYTLWRCGDKGMRKQKQI